LLVDPKRRIRLLYKPDGSENTFLLQQPSITVMLRNEAFASDENDASFIRMTAVKKD